MQAAMLKAMNTVKKSTDNRTEAELCVVLKPGKERRDKEAAGI